MTFLLQTAFLHRPAPRVCVGCVREGADRCFMGRSALGLCIARQISQCLRARGYFPGQSAMAHTRLDKAVSQPRKRATQGAALICCNSYVCRGLALFQHFAAQQFCDLHSV